MRFIFAHNDELNERSGRAERASDGSLLVFWEGENHERLEAGEWFELGGERIAIRRQAEAVDGAQTASPAHRDGWAQGAQVVIPVVEEFLEIERHMTEAGKVRVEKHVDRIMENISQQVRCERAAIERVPVGRVLDVGEQVQVQRGEGVVIIPIIEERCVVTTQRVLTEEIHIQVHVEERTHTEQVEVRRERVDVQRFEPDGSIREPGR